MNYSGELIDQIVLSVMRELNLRQSRTESDAPAESAGTLPLTVSGSVITEDVLTRLEAAGRLVQLSSAAIITPSGRDYIRRHNVRLTSVCLPGGGGSPRKMAGLPGGAADSPPVASGVLVTIGTLATSTAAAASVGWSTRVVSDEVAAVELLSPAAAGSVHVCCGGEASVVACRLNRNPAVRAAVVCPATDIEHLRTVMNPGIFCLAATGWSFVEIRRLLRSVCGDRSLPADWKEVAVLPARQGVSP